MPDRENVIKDLEEVRRFIECENLPAHTLKAKLVIDDALALLKAQEPLEPIYGEDNYIRCGKCKHNIVGIIAQDTGNRMPIQKFCAECGQAVKWE